jgi:hypothetical protein
MYIDNLRRLRDAVRRKRLEKWRTNSWFLLHYNAPAHRSFLVNDFLAKNNVATLEHPLYSPVCSLFLPALMGRRFCDATDVIKNATEELKRLSRKYFQKCFQQLYSRQQKCVAAQGDYFEGNIA